MFVDIGEDSLTESQPVQTVSDPAKEIGDEGRVPSHEGAQARRGAQVQILVGGPGLVSIAMARGMSAGRSPWAGCV